MDEAFNMSVRRFLKEVGVTSQREIERAVREAGGLRGPAEARIVLTVPDLGLTHEVTGRIGPGTAE